MKKILIILSLLLITGCGKDKVLTCTIDIGDNVYTLNATYKIYHDGKYVNKVVKNEKYITSNKDKYNYLKNYRELELENMKSTYGGYDYKMDLKREEISIKTTIIFKYVDVNKLVDDKLINKYYVSKDKMLLSGLKKYYESKSAVCK